MQISVKILDVQVETKKGPRNSYKVASVDYKDLDSGKPGSRKVMSFGPSEAVFGYLAGHDCVGKEFKVTAEKINDFWNWVAIEEGNGGDDSQVASMPNVAASSNGNGNVRNSGSGNTTDVERQRLIVRQNALTNAIKFLEVTGNKKASLNDVAQLVEQFDSIVFGTFTPELETGAKKIPKSAAPVTEELEDDIPF